MKFFLGQKRCPSFLLNTGTILIVAVMLIVNQAYAKSDFSPTTSLFSSGLLSYQGTMTDKQGSPLTDSYEMTFKIYPGLTGGTALWTESRVGANAVQVKNGLFNVMLGSLVPIPETVWETPELYLGVKIGSDAEMTPREKLSMVPSAARADVADLAMTVPDSSITDQKLGSDVNNYLIQNGVNQSSTYLDPAWTLDEGTGARDYRTRITFSSVFDTPPKVSVQLSQFDIASVTNPRFLVVAENVTTDGFDLVYGTWADTIVYGASASWIAYGLQ